jgi:hypothetical protein
MTADEIRELRSSIQTAASKTAWLEKEILLELCDLALCWWRHYERLLLLRRLEDNARECRVISPVVKNVKREKE